MTDQGKSILASLEAPTVETNNQVHSLMGNNGGGGTRWLLQLFVQWALYLGLHISGQSDPHPHGTTPMTGLTSI